MHLVDSTLLEPKAGDVVVQKDAGLMISSIETSVQGKSSVYHTPYKSFVPGGNGVGIIYSVGSEVRYLESSQGVVISPHVARKRRWIGSVSPRCDRTWIRCRMNAGLLIGQYTGRMRHGTGHGSNLGRRVRPY